MTQIPLTNIPEKVLIVKPSSLGDIFHTFPAVSLLVEAWPNSEFHWLVAPQFASVIKYSPAVTKTIIFPRRELGAAKTILPAFFKLKHDLRQTTYTTVIDFQGLLRSAFFAKIAPAAQHIGFDSPRESLARVFYNQRIKLPNNCKHAVDRNLFMAEKISGLQKTFQQLPPLPSINAFAVNATRLLNNAGCDSDDQIIGVALGARWESKRWSDKFFTTLLRELTKQLPRYKIILLGATDCLSSAQNITTTLNNRQIVSLVGKTSLTELIEVIQQCKIVICNDSGPMHIAAAANKPVFAFFGPTIPANTGPYGSKHYIFQSKIDCIGCLKRYCPKGTMLCHELDINAIVEAVIKYMN